MVVLFLVGFSLWYFDSALEKGLLSFRLSLHNNNPKFTKYEDKMLENTWKGINWVKYIARFFKCSDYFLVIVASVFSQIVPVISLKVVSLNKN